MKKRLLSSVAALALATAQISPGFALSPSQVYQQNTNPVPNPDGYSADRLLHQPAPTLGAGTTIGNDIVAGQSFVASAVANLKTYVLALLQQNYTLQVPSAAALRTTAVFTGVMAHRGGYAAAGDGGAAGYVGSTSACPSGDDGGSCLNAPGGSWRISWASVGDRAAVALFGSFGAGDAAADTAGLQAALNTGKPVYLPGTSAFYKITGGTVTVKTTGQRIFGDGRTRTTINCYLPASPAATNPCLTYLTGEEGPILSDLAMFYSGLPDTASTTDKTAYGPLIYAQNTPRMRMFRLRLAAANVDVDMRGNSGGLVADDIEYNCTTTCWQIDGSIDSNRWDHTHGYPFNLTANQQTVFYGSATAFDMGRMDDFRISNSLWIGHLAFSFHLNNQTAFPGGPLGSIDNFDFDSHTGIVMTAGTVTCSACLFTQGTAADFAVNLAGAGVLDLAVPQFFLGAALSQPMVQVTGLGGKLTINGGSTQYAPGSNFDVTAFGVYKAGAELSLLGHSITKPPGTSGTPMCTQNPIIAKAAGRLTAIGNRMSDIGAVSSGYPATCKDQFIAVSTDDYDRVMGNTGPAWPNSFPSSPSNGVYLSN